MTLNMVKPTGKENKEWKDIYKDAIKTMDPNKFKENKTDTAKNIVLDDAKIVAVINDLLEVEKHNGLIMIAMKHEVEYERVKELYAEVKAEKEKNKVA